MSVEGATGIILRARPLSETSLIVHWLTEELGRVDVVAKGARRPKSPFRGQLDLFYLAQFSFQRSRRSELHLLREVKLLRSHPDLRRELSHLRQASYCANLIEQTTPLEAPAGHLFAQFAQLLQELPRHPAAAPAVLAFEMKLLKEVGLMPKLAQETLTAGARRILEELVERDWRRVFQLRPSAGQLAEMGEFLRRFLVFHLDKVPGGRDAALCPAGPLECQLREGDRSIGQFC
jgi:DNA repair protein RecO (recombination protein O)